MRSVAVESQVARSLMGQLLVLLDHSLLLQLLEQFAVLVLNLDQLLDLFPRVCYLLHRALD